MANKDKKKRVDLYIVGVVEGREVYEVDAVMMMMMVMMMIVCRIGVNPYNRVVIFFINTTF